MSKKLESDPMEKWADVQSKHGAQIAEIKGKLGSELTPSLDDTVIYRFLRTHKFDVAKATKAVEATAKWRKDMKIDAIRAAAVPLPQEKWPAADKIAKFFPLNWAHKTDKKGRLIEIDFTGHSKPAQLAKEMTRDEFTHFCIHQWEKAAEAITQQTKTTGTVARFAQIADMNGLGLKHLDLAGLAYVEYVTTLFQIHYPDMLGDVYIVNAPWLFNTFWKLSSSWLAEEVRNSTHMLEDLEKLKDIVAVENLPAHLGGKCECKGGCIREVDPDEGFTKVEVKASNHHQVKFDVAAGTLVSWEYRTKGKDIGFAATFTPAGEAKQVLVKLLRRPSHIRGMDGGMEAKKTGVLTLTWDNSYSVTSGKTLLFRVDFRTPETLDKSISAQLDTSAVEASLKRLNIEEKSA